MTEEKIAETGEITKTTEIKVDMSGMQNAIIEKQEAQIKALSEKMDAMMKIVEQRQPQVMETKENKTVGIVKEEAKVAEIKNNDIVIEKADFGKGFQIYRNYDKESCKFKRLVR